MNKQNNLLYKIRIHNSRQMLERMFPKEHMSIADRYLLNLCIQNQYNLSEYNHDMSFTNKILGEMELLGYKPKIIKIDGKWGCPGVLTSTKTL